MKYVNSTTFFGLAYLCFSFIPFQVDAQGVFNSIENKFNQYKSSAPKERVLILTDRDIYAPGELLWFNVTSYNIFSSSVSELSKEVSIYLVNNQSQDVLVKKIKLEGGNASGFIQIPNLNQDGIYYLQGETENSDKLSYYYKKIVIKKKILPQFIIKVCFPENDYIPGDQIDMTIEFQDFYNEPKRNVDYTIDFFDGGKRISGLIGKTKKTGLAPAGVKVPMKLRSGLFSYTIAAETKDAQATLSGSFPVLTDQIFIDYYPENGKVIDAINTRISFFSYDATGNPLAIEADLIESGNRLLTFTSESNGLGYFNFTPDLEKSYYVVLKRPLLLEKKYEFPPVEAKGIALKEISKDASHASYMLVNGYQSIRTVFLVGVSEGDIFWKSEFEIDRELEVEIDLSKAKGRLAHIIALNAAEKIEGEHILLVPGILPKNLNVKSEEFSPVIRGKNELEIDLNSSGEGKIIFTVVNSPWLSDNLNNQNVNILSLPFDIGTQLVFQSSEFCHSELSDQDVEKYKNLYVPFGFSWGRILNTKGALNYVPVNDLVTVNLRRKEHLSSNHQIEVSNGKITHANITTAQVFVTSNPKYTASLYEVKKSRVPAYKLMLQNGTPILEVLQSIKPFNLQGNYIVFLGSANSINFQGGALIVIDGINRGTDASVLASFSPYDVETMSASTNPNDIQRYTGLNSVGLIEITLKKGGGIIEEKEEVAEDTQFTAPEYKNEHPGNLDDFRSTLWWQVISNPDQENVISFYNSELISTAKGVVYFIPRNGNPTFRKFEYVIR